MKPPPYQELEGNLKQALDPSKPKLLAVIAKGMAPLPAPVLVASWCYLSHSEDTQIRESAQKSLAEYPEKNIIAALDPQFPGWGLYQVFKSFSQNENLIEKILLHGNTPIEVFLELAPICSEAQTQIIVNNQERIIESPELVVALESNPNNLKSNTDRLRQFLRLAGIFIPGSEDEKSKLVAEAQTQQPEVTEDAIEELIDAEVLTEEKRMSLHQYIMGLSIGAKVKLAVKGNKEARGILIRDTNKVVATAVLKSPRINDNEVAHYANLKNLAEDVIRVICRTPGWTKLYPVKLALVNHPKAPLSDTLQYIKSLTLRDLQQLSRAKTIQAPLRKAAKALLNIKRK